jgi:hypothetical protein
MSQACRRARARIKPTFAAVHPDAGFYRRPWTAAHGPPPATRSPAIPPVPCSADSRIANKPRALRSPWDLLCSVLFLSAIRNSLKRNGAVWNYSDKDMPEFPTFDERPRSSRCMLLPSAVTSMKGRFWVAKIVGNGASAERSRNGSSKDDQPKPKAN